MGYGSISETVVEPYPHRVRRNAPRPFAGLSPPGVFLALRAAPPLDDKPMRIIDYCRTIVRGCVDPREKSVIVPGLSGFLKRAQDSSPMVALPLCPSPSQSAVSGYGWGSTSCGVVSTREVIVVTRVVGPVEIRGIHESGMGPYLPRVRRKCPPLMGLYPSRTALWSSNQSSISQRDWGFLTVQGGVDPTKLGLLRALPNKLAYILAYIGFFSL